MNCIFIIASSLHPTECTFYSLNEEYRVNWKQDINLNLKLFSSLYQAFSLKENFHLLILALQNNRQTYSYFPEKSADTQKNLAQSQDGRCSSYGV